MQNNQGERKYSVCIEIFDIQQKRKFTESVQLMARNEDEAKLFAIYAIRKVYISQYQFRPLSCIELPSIIL